MNNKELNINKIKIGSAIFYMVNNVDLEVEVNNCSNNLSICKSEVRQNNKMIISTFYKSISNFSLIEKDED